MTHRIPGLKPNPLALAVAATLSVSAPAMAGPAPGAAIGSETQVSQATGFNQVQSRMAMDAAGDYVVVWTSVGQDGDGGGIYARRYAADGTPLGDEFQVNTTAAADQFFPAVAMDAAGDFVVTWESYTHSGTELDVFEQRYDSSGNPHGGELQVNSVAGASQPAIAMDATGDFVITWSGPDNTHAYQVFAQRFDSAGNALGGAVQVSSGSAAPAYGWSSAAMDMAGNFVVAWIQSGVTPTIWVQRYDNTGTAKGAAMSVSATGVSPVSDPTLAADAAGDFVVTWAATGADGSGAGVDAIKYNSAGVVQLGKFLVNTTTAGDQAHSSVAMDASGDFVVSWQNVAIGGASDISGQRFQADGTPAGTEFHVNSTIVGNQQEPNVAMDAAGDFAVSWQSPDDTQYGIFAQRYVRSAGLDLSAGLTLLPSSVAVFHTGDPLFLDATITNNATVSTLTGNATIDTALTTATGVQAVMTLPAGTVLVTPPGAPWNCATPVGNVLTCQYTGSLAAQATQAAVVKVTLSATAGVQSFTNAAAGGQPDDDASNDSASAGVTSDTAPVALDGGLTAAQGSSNNPGTLAATDVDTGDVLTYSKLSDPAHGAVTVEGGGSYFYTPANGYTGPDSFTFKANDGLFDSGTGTVNINIRVENAPVAQSGVLAVNRNTAKAGAVLATDADVGDALTYALLSNAAHGQVAMNGDGTYTYTPAAGYVGADSFAFSANDGLRDSNIATITVTVAEHAPVAYNASFSMTRNSSHKGILKASDADKGDKLKFSKVTAPSHGSVSIGTGGGYTYTPAKNFTGTDKFTFKVSDGLKSDTAVVSITVK